MTRFIQEATSGTNLIDDFDKYSDKDIELRKERHEMILDVTKDIENYKLYLAAEKLYHYTWHTFADEILEESKTIFENGTDEEKKSRKQFLIHTLDKLLKSLHPFMPFITEEIYQSLPYNKDNGLLMVAKWPVK